MKTYVCMPTPVIRSGSISLSAVQPDHIQSIRRWRNEQLDVLRQAGPISEDEQQAYYERVIWSDMNTTHPRQVLLSIFENEVFVGYGGLVHVSWPDLRAEVSFLLDPNLISDAARYDALFSGYLRVVKLLAFRDLGLKRLFTETYAYRTAHVSILERNGFLPEGRLCAHVRINGQPIDSLLHGVSTYDER